MRKRSLRRLADGPQSGHAKRGNRSGTGHKPAGYVKRVDTPKAQRERAPRRTVPVLVDVLRTLGYPARPRSTRGRRWR